MNVRYITIEREYGSGGTQIAEEVAKKTGISCYGREILEIVAQNNNLTVSDLENYEENVANSFLYSLYVMGQAQSGNTDILPMESKLYIEEHKVISSLALEGPAIFVGRCACEALKNESGVLRVFIRANEEFKKKRAVDIYGIPQKNAASVCKRFNKRRANYYAFNTSSKWEDLSNYDIVLDSSRIGIEGCVNALAALIEG